PYAVSAFFAGGGRRARIVRIVHGYGGDADGGGRATGVMIGLRTDAGAAVRLYARDEGRWGDGLRAVLRFDTRPVALLPGSTSARLVVDRGEWVPVGSLLRLGLGGGSQFVYVDDSRELRHPLGTVVDRALELATPVPAVAVAAEVVTARLEVVDVDRAIPRREELTGLGLRADHPRWLARAVATESALVWPDASWAASTVRTAGLALTPIALAAPVDPEDPDRDLMFPGTERVDHMTGGADRWADIVVGDFFDPRWVLGDELPGDGIDALADDAEVGIVLAPDLYDPSPLPPADEVDDVPTLCGPEFQVALDEPAAVPRPPVAPQLEGLRRDPLESGDYAAIVAAQRRLVDWADARRDVTVLLDVPPGLSRPRMLAWRNEFDSAFAAAYHPWLDVAAPDDRRDALVRVNPSAFAAAILAAREVRFGVQHGPANELAAGAVRVADDVAPAVHDALHLAGIDVFLAERDGIRLTGARTLSRQAELRQLSVARLMTVLRLTLEREMTWAVFEPSDPELWAEVERLVHDLLSRFYQAGAFAGATTKEAFFVRCDRTTMTAHDLDNGRLVCLVGVAPVEPVEYLVIEIALTSDTLRVAMA
ncbi:phage tail sheath C-terminal domain-containing protein, partial [Microbacterium sp.]|uniref:phage tail sheath C-terminal domain-containing protein n=1 Tax=Microbacterium sp. TaxID=51671 RepID=UPI003221B3CA